MNTVLLVEDNPNMLQVNARVLENEGYIVPPARNIMEARQAMSGINPQVIVMDVELPDGSGLDFCRELCDPDSWFSYNPKLRKIPVVFLTSLKGEEYEQAGYDAGADDYIVKPYRIERLTESIGAMINQKRNKM